MRIAIETFRGMVPKPDPRLLPVEVANLAINCRFDRGQLEPYKEPFISQPMPIPNVKTLFRYQGNFWFVWDSEVDIAPSPIDQDVYARVYFTGTDAPRVTYNTVATTFISEIKQSDACPPFVPNNFTLSASVLAELGA